MVLRRWQPQIGPGDKPSTRVASSIATRRSNGKAVHLIRAVLAALLPLALATAAL
jgi:hypothetical protein